MDIKMNRIISISPKGMEVLKQALKDKKKAVPVEMNL